MKKCVKTFIPEENLDNCHSDPLQFALAFFKLHKINNENLIKPQKNDFEIHFNLRFVSGNGMASKIGLRPETGLIAVEFWKGFRHQIALTF